MFRYVRTTIARGAFYVLLAVAASSRTVLAQGRPATPVSAQPDRVLDLSPWGMFLAADPVVKAVLLGLALASAVTWAVWLWKSLELVAANRRVRGGLARLASARHVFEVAQQPSGLGGVTGQFVDAATAELRICVERMESHGIKERVASRLERIEASGGRQMMRGTGVLATIGATAPFVGLFGTVWGIMNSFIGISKSQTTNLAVVAPGIAEALLATAIGLVVAIPAVVIYNTFSRQIASHRALLADASSDVLRLVARDLDLADAQPAATQKTRTPAPSFVAAE